MRVEEAQHVAWAYGRAREALRCLASVNADFRDRLRWAIEALGPIPRGGLPDPIIEQLRALDEQMLAPVVNDRLSAPFSVVSWNLRKLSWKKRQTLSDQIINICVSICEACAVHQRSW
jgi:hypothetical protein